MLNLSDCIVSFCVTLLVTTASLHLKIVEPRRTCEGGVEKSPKSRTMSDMSLEVVKKHPG